ncbi:MAG: cAMP-activated global transcriptional regulator CRP, partial [Methylovulum sp.]
MISNARDKAYKEAIDQFLRFCHKKTYPAKAIIIRPGDIGNSLYFIVGGSVSVHAEDDESGRELILAYLNKNEFIGEIGIFKGPDVRKVTIKARSDCQLAEISYDRFDQVIKKELKDYAADLLYMLGEHLADRLLTTNRKFCDLAFMDVEGRILQTLYDLCKQPDAMTHPDGMQLNISRQEIGRIVGCSREMAGRVLKDLES